MISKQIYRIYLQWILLIKISSESVNHINTCNKSVSSDLSYDSTNCSNQVKKLNCLHVDCVDKQVKSATLQQLTSCYFSHQHASVPLTSHLFLSVTPTTLLHLPEEARLMV